MTGTVVGVIGEHAAQGRKEADRVAIPRWARSGGTRMQANAPSTSQNAYPRATLDRFSKPPVCRGIVGAKVLLYSYA
jgi:hypothetical protein